MEVTISMSRIGYNLKQAFSQMGRNKGMYFTSVLAITAMMLILGLFFVAFVNVNLFTITIEKDYNVIQIYLKDGNSQEVTDAVKTSLEAMGGVDTVTYVSKDDALVTLKERWGENGYLLDNLPKNPLPDSYTVYVEDKDAANALAEAAPTIEGVDDVVYYRDTIEKLAQVSHFIEMGSLIAMAFLVIVSIIIVANTIKLTVFNREKEIGIMKYLGATDWFVRAPFIVEGILLGAIGAVLPLTVMYFAYDRLVGALLSRFDILSTIASSLPDTMVVFRTLVPVGLLLGVGIGLFGSIITVRKHLSV
jgi:cell division transport system permease protein